MSEDETEHLANLSDGAGCTEIWEHLSAQRAETEGDDTSEESETEATDGGRDVRHATVDSA